jgi:hypothetical protein
MVGASSQKLTQYSRSKSQFLAQPDQILMNSFSHLSLELTPVHSMQSVNEPLELHEGPMVLHQGSTSVSGAGAITLNWLPIPHLSLRVLPSSPTFDLKLEPAEVELTDPPGVRVKVDLVRIQLSIPATSPGPIEARAAEVRFGNLDCFERLRFQIPNFAPFIGQPVRSQKGGMRACRAVLEQAPWRIILDEAIGFRGKRVDELRKTGGYDLTHVGVLERIDGSSFSLPDSEPILECLRYFLSYCRSAWTAPILFRTEDGLGNALGELWSVEKVDRYFSTTSWLPTSEPVVEHLAQAFKGYLGVWNDPDQSDAMRYATQWYLESSVGAAEKAIILMQAAFELLSWTLLVQKETVLSADGWNRLPASDKLRLLLAHCSIPSSVPDEFIDLNAYCKEFNLTDGPGAATDIRNILVHSDPGKRARLKKHANALMDIWLLGSWYLDLIILQLCGYSGRYSNRLVREGWRGQEVESVPWG